MQTSSVQSAPCATPEAANDALGGLLLQAGQNQTVKVISTDVHEVDGLWVATAFFQIETLDQDETQEENPQLSENEKEDSLEMNDDNDVALWHGLTKQQEPELPPSTGLPVEDPEIGPADPGPFIISTDHHEPAPQSFDDVAALSPTMQEQAEELQQQFAQAEEPQTDPALILLPPSVETELTYEQRRELEEKMQEHLEEERLAILRREAVPRPVEALVEAPAEPAPSDS